MHFHEALPDLSGVNFNEVYRAHDVPHDVPDPPPSNDDEEVGEEFGGEGAKLGEEEKVDEIE